MIGTSDNANKSAYHLVCLEFLAWKVIGVVRGRNVSFDRKAQYTVEDRVLRNQFRGHWHFFLGLW